MLLRMRESESGTLPRTKVWYGAKPNNGVSQQTRAESELLAKGVGDRKIIRLTFGDRTTIRQWD